MLDWDQNHLWRPPFSARQPPWSWASSLYFAPQPFAVNHRVGKRVEPLLFLPGAQRIAATVSPRFLTGSGSDDMSDIKIRATNGKRQAIGAARTASNDWLKLSAP